MSIDIGKEACGRRLGNAPAGAGAGGQAHVRGLGRGEIGAVIEDVVAALD